MASNYIGQKVICIDFNDLNEIETFDAIWAGASLVHVSKKEMLTIIEKIITSLKNEGYIYICLKNGYGSEVDDRGRYFSYYTKEKFEELISLQLVEFWSSKSVTNLSETKYWNNFILKKTVSNY